MSWFVKHFAKDFSNRTLAIGEIILILGFAAIPLFINLPYRINIFISWEGAYRLASGHIPYKDFGIPTGFTFWLIPALFFKLFGPYLITLVKAQAFINVISGLTFRSILGLFSIQSGQRLILVLLYCLTYSFFNFWPWYNHSVFIFELIGLYFLLKALLDESKYQLLFVSLSGLFITLSFLTKQDGGGLGGLICIGILSYYTWDTKSYKQILTFIISTSLMIVLLVVPFLKYDFGYWFNYGQPPHYSRISFFDLVDTFLAESFWLKFYMIVIVLVLLNNHKSFPTLLKDRIEMIFILLTFGIIAQASIVQVTSYTPPNNNIYYHCFAITFLLSRVKLKLNFRKVSSIVFFSGAVFLWWSGAYWNYILRIYQRYYPMETVDPDKVVDKNTYMISLDTLSVQNAEQNWELSDYKTFKGIYMPQSTIKGLKRVETLPQFEKGKSSILNMTELSPLANEWDFELDKGGHPLWYHHNVSMFDREADKICRRISALEYDIILFEDIPGFNNFFSYDIQACVKENYRLVDQFAAPRRPVNGTIEVYIKD